MIAAVGRLGHLTRIVTIMITVTIMTIRMGTRMTDLMAGLQADGLLRLTCWLSPAFPVGGFSYSHGIEYAVECGLLTGRAEVSAWIFHILRHGAGWIDAGLFLAAHRAVQSGGTVAEVAAWATALRGTAETALEARAQGAAFVAALTAAWSDAAFAAQIRALPTPPSYAVAVAMAAACAQIPEAPALLAFMMAVAANFVSAAVRLVPLGQSDGQRVTADLATRLPDLVQAALVCPFEELGSAASMVDWTSTRHETQYTRLFRS